MVYINNMNILDAFFTKKGEDEELVTQLIMPRVLVTTINSKFDRVEKEVTIAGITIPRGFVTDWASIPSWIQWLQPKESETHGLHLAALLHDYMYTYKIGEEKEDGKESEGEKEKRFYADMLFMQVAILYNVPPYRALLMTYIVRAFGAKRWGARTAQDKYGY